MMRSAAVSAVMTVSLLGGCGSLDSRPDVQASAELVHARTGYQPGWNELGQEVIWDGRSPISAAQAVRLALASNPSIQADLAEIAAARADLVQAGLLPNPMLSAGLGFGIDGGGVTMLSAGAMQSLSSLWLRPTRKAAAQARLQQTVLRVSDTAIALAAQTAAGHRRVLHYQALAGLLEEIREILAESVRAGEARFAAGIGTSLDVNRLRAELLEAEAEQRGNHRMLAVAKRQLLERMGQANCPGEWIAASDDEEAQDPEIPDEPALIELASRQRLDVLAAEWAVRAQEQSLRTSRLEALPELAAGVEYTRDAPPGEMTMNAIGPAVTMTVPILDPGHARIARSRAELRRSALRADAARQQAVLEVRSAFQSHQVAMRQVQAYRQEIVPLTTRNLAETQAAFRAGQVDVLDVLSAQQSWAAARLRLQEALLDRDVSLIDLNRAAGGSVSLEASDEPPSP